MYNGRFFYKFGDTVATSLITPFYIDVGFSNTVIGTVAKVVGLWSMLIGGFLGGLLMYKIGINKALWVFGIIQMLSILGFAVLNEVGPVVWVLLSECFAGFAFFTLRQESIPNTVNRMIILFILGIFFYLLMMYNRWYFTKLSMGF